MLYFFFIFVAYKIYNKKNMKNKLNDGFYGANNIYNPKSQPGNRVPYSNKNIIYDINY